MDFQYEDKLLFVVISVYKREWLLIVIINLINYTTD